MRDDKVVQKIVSIENKYSRYENSLSVKDIIKWCEIVSNNQSSLEENE